ncbi:MBL fold metallo-hydrolase [Pseudaestuariivita rosea]|uniref:MBL fold metallo-hydrolase n=1 Tax=Pseudaestuariivita rosea TaxID=2763263 RepID=UPI001ABB5754|nr:MBL fold metallo-hydrolase [Pseudaestuariivita rosea]
MIPVFANSAHVFTRERLVLRGGRLTKVALRVRFGLIRHPKHGPVLIDAGYGPRVTQGAGRSAALKLYAALLKPRLDPLQSPLAVLAHYGFDPADVQTIIVTHLHADHVTYLRDFPNARFIIAPEAVRFMANHSHLGNVHHGIFTELLPDDFADRLIDPLGLPQVEAPFGLGQGADLFGDGSILTIPLPGHAPGHLGVCFPHLDPPLLYATDAQWMMQAITQDRVPGFPATPLVFHDRAASQASITRIRAFIDQGGEVLLCHDPAPSRYDFTDQTDG